MTGNQWSENEGNAFFKRILKLKKGVEKFKKGEQAVDTASLK